MATTFDELRDELYARGYTYLDNAAASRLRAGRWINQAYNELCAEERWPFLLTTANGAAPLAVADVRWVLSVTDTVGQRVLAPLPEAELSADMTVLATTGSPIWFYLDNTTIRTYPVGGTLAVRYYKKPALLSADGDQVVVPDEWVNLIVDGAVRRAANDNDDPQSARTAEAERILGLDSMRRALLIPTRQYQRITFSAQDW